MFKKNVKYTGPRYLNAWRKIAIGTWRSAGDPSIYAIVDVDARPVYRAIERYKEKGIKLTPTAVVAKAIAYAMSEYPQINSIQRFGRLYQRENVDIFLQVSSGKGGENLSGMVVKNCDKKSFEEIAAEIKSVSGRIKDGDDKDFEKVKGTMDFLPGFIVGPILTVMGFILYGLNLWSKLLGAPRDGFGSAMVTSVGMMGVEYAFAPLVPYSRSPLVVAVGKIIEKPIVEDGNIVPCPILPINGTLDHRVIDGAGGGKMIKAVKEFIANLDQY